MMTFSEAWDRMFWSAMLVIFVGLLWLKYLDDEASCEGTGIIFAIAVGIAFFSSGWYQAQRRKQKEEQAEQPSPEEIQIPEELL